MRVLVVEDEPEIAESLCHGLNEAGIRSRYVVNGIDALTAFGEGLPYDVAIVDVTLGGSIDGYEVCRRLRNGGSTTAVLMLTARGEVADRLRGFDAGADDYMAKPFSFEEVLARVRSLSRRRLATPLGSDLEVEDLHIDTRSRTATVGTVRLELSLREYEVLELFLRHPGQVLTKAQMHDAIWSHDTVPDSGLVEVYVGRVRRKLTTAMSVMTIENKRGLGYQLARQAAVPSTS